MTYLAFDKSAEFAAGRIEALDDGVDATGGVRPAQEGQQLLELGVRALGHDVHSAVGEVRRVADEPQLECAHPC